MTKNEKMLYEKLIKVLETEIAYHDAIAKNHRSDGAEENACYENGMAAGYENILRMLRGDYGISPATWIEDRYNRFETCGLIKTED